MKTNSTLNAVLLFALLCVGGVAAARSTSMREMARQPTAEILAPLSVDAVRRAIVAGGATEEWKAVADQRGVVTLARNKGIDVVVVDVLYDAQGWQIVYKSSDGFDYERTDQGIEIHPDYNEWVAALDADIRRAIANAMTQRR